MLSGRPHVEAAALMGAHGLRLVPLRPKGTRRMSAHARFAFIPGDAAARVVQRFIAERRRQIEVAGWTPEHDDWYVRGEMGRAAGCYAMAALWPEHARQFADGSPPSQWRWAAEWWKPSDPLTMLVKAGALLIAEVERLERLGDAHADREDQPHG